MENELTIPESHFDPAVPLLSIELREMKLTHTQQFLYCMTGKRQSTNKSEICSGARNKVEKREVGGDRRGHSKRSMNKHEGF